MAEMHNEVCLFVMRCKSTPDKTCRMFPQTYPEIPKKTPNTLLGFKKKKKKPTYLFILLQHCHRRAEIKTTIDTSDLLYKDAGF